MPAARPGPPLAANRGGGDGTVGVLSIALFAALLAGCPAGDDDDATAPPDPPCSNDGPPSVGANPIEDGQPVGFPVQVLALVSDGDGLSTVTLHFRPAASLETWSEVFMSKVGEQDDGFVFAAAIPGNAVVDGGVDWYVEANDVDNGCQETATAPPGAPDNAASFTTQLNLTPLPFSEDFEVDGEDCGTEETSQIGWTSEITSFPQAIHAWRLRPQSPLSGRCAASHSEGIPGGFWECPPPDSNGTIERKNWLVSPPLDFRGKTEVATRWFERRVDSGICAELHQLYVSTTSPDPAGDGWTLVSDVPLPGDAWGSSPWYDLSEYAGEERVFLALYYEGGAAGRWQVDDFYVGEPLADIQLDSVDPLVEPVGPGSTDVQLQVELVNASELYGAPELTATLTTADADLTITAGDATLAALAPGFTAAPSAPFVFDIGAAHPDNAFLDFAIVLDDGADHTWTVPVRVLLGQESSVRVDYTAIGFAEAEFELGYGFEAAPDFAIAVDSVDLPGFWQMTITDHAAVLPPGPGPRRWFLKASRSNGFDVTVDAVTFTVGGVETVADLGDGPLTLPAPGEEVLIYIPAPPSLSVTSYETDPSPPVPGGTVLVEDVILQNGGNPTAGPVVCGVGSSDPHVSNVSSDPVAFGPDPIGTDGIGEAQGSFSFDLDEAHIDNSPVALTLVCLDGAETFALPFGVDVPHAHPTVQAWAIDDSSCPACDDDAVFDAGELVEVRLVALNDGAFDTDGPVTATVTVGTGSTAAFTMDAVAVLEFGPDPLLAGASATSIDGFSVALGPDALMGDTIVLDIEFAAGDDVWTEQAVLEAVGIDWIDCPEADDPQFDVLGTGTFDIKGCAFRSDGLMLQVRLDSWTDYSPTAQLVDFFFFETPNTFSIESVGGNPDFETGCVFDDEPPEVITIYPEVELSLRSATVRLAIADIGALGNNTQVAFGAGSCPGDYFCDLYPGPPTLFFDLVAGSYNCDGASFIPINWPSPN